MIPFRNIRIYYKYNCFSQKFVKMASVNEEENVTHESGRRTRSGRKVVTPSTITPVKPKRRTTRKLTQEQVVEPEPEIIEIIEEEEEASSFSEQSDIIKEMLAEAAQGVIGDETSRSQPFASAPDNDEQVEEVEEVAADMIEEEIIEEEVLDDFIDEIKADLEDEMQTELFEEEVATELVEEEVHTVIAGEDHMTEIIDDHITEIRDGHITEISDGHINEIGDDPMTEVREHIEEELLTETVSENEMDMEADAAVADSSGLNANTVDDEKSSSFPFGNNVAQNENSENGPNEAAAAESEETNTNEYVESSLLASLAGDNANSLPSVGEEEGETKSFVEKILITTNEDDESSSGPAIREDLENNNSCSDATLINTEMVSEDELPMPTKPEVNDAEEVSDEELPAPARAELPADTEVVSEDELPTNGISNTKKSEPAVKRKADEEKVSEEYNPNSPTSESNDGPVEKKVKVDTEGEEQKEQKEKKKEKKKLPDLDKYWKAVKDDSADFTGWTYLLQYVDQETDVEAAREAYDAFLSHYPYCYGYWRKYADYEKRKGLKTKCNEVFERGLKAIPLSVDLWIHYLTHVKTNQGDNVEFIRSQFERAVNACGLEFRSDKLWDAYIKWETEGKRYQNVMKIYDRLLTIPTQGYNNHFGSCQDLINNHPASALISTEEFKQLRTEVREALKASKESSKQQEIDDGIPGAGSDDELDLADEADDHVRNDEEMAAIKDKIISSRRKLHKATVAAVTARWTFEEGIKRPYFHVKPLERCQLKNWKEYLDFEIEKGDQTRVLILFERCLIACALYDEFWLKLIRYLEAQTDPELIPVTRDAYNRACTIHHPDKPSLHLMWSAFEECQNDFDKAAEILINLEKTCPNLLQIAYRRINVERRRGDHSKCKDLYEYYIEAAKNKNIGGSLAIKYARFCNKICGDLDGAIKILQNALNKDPANTRVALQMIDVALQRPVVDEAEVVSIMDKFMSRDNIELEQKVLFAQRKVEFLEDFGSKASGLLEAQRALQFALNKVNEAKKKSDSSPNKKSSTSTSSKDGGNSSNQTPAAASYNNSTSSASANYNYGSGTSSSYYGQSGQPSYQQQQYDGYYNHWQYGSGYSGYGQWSGYGNYY